MFDFGKWASETKIDSLSLVTDLLETVNSADDIPDALKFLDREIARINKSGAPSALHEIVFYKATQQYVICYGPKNPRYAEQERRELDFILSADCAANALARLTKAEELHRLPLNTVNATRNQIRHNWRLVRSRVPLRARIVEEVKDKWLLYLVAIITSYLMR